MERNVNEILVSPLPETKKEESSRKGREKRFQMFQTSENIVGKKTDHMERRGQTRDRHTVFFSLIHRLPRTSTQERNLFSFLTSISYRMLLLLLDEL